MILIRTTVALLRQFISSKLFKFYMSCEINSVRMDKIRRDYLIYGKEVLNSKNTCCLHN